MANIKMSNEQMRHALRGLHLRLTELERQNPNNMQASGIAEVIDLERHIAEILKTEAPDRLQNGGREMALRLGIGYEQEEPGLYVYDDQTGFVMLSSDVQNEELLKKLKGSLIQFTDAPGGILAQASDRY